MLCHRKLDPVMDQQNIASLFYGPVLLAAQETEARKEWRKITLNAEDISKSIKGNPEQLHFNIGDVVFKPPWFCASVDLPRMWLADRMSALQRFYHLP